MTENGSTGKKKALGWLGSLGVFAVKNWQITLGLLIVAVAIILLRNVIGMGVLLRICLIGGLFSVFLFTDWWVEKIFISKLSGFKKKLGEASEYVVFFGIAVLFFFMFDEYLDDSIFVYIALVCAIPVLGWLSSSKRLGVHGSAFGRRVMTRISFGMLLLTVGIPAIWLDWTPMQSIEYDDRSSQNGGIVRYEVTAMVGGGDALTSEKFWAQAEPRYFLLKPSRFTDQIKTWTHNNADNPEASMGAWTIGRRRNWTEGGHPRIIDLYEGDGPNGEASKKWTPKVIGAFFVPGILFGGYMLIGLLLPRFNRKEDNSPANARPSTSAA